MYLQTDHQNTRRDEPTAKTDRHKTSDSKYQPISNYDGLEVASLKKYDDMISHSPRHHEIAQLQTLLNKKNRPVIKSTIEPNNPTPRQTHITQLHALINGANDRKMSSGVVQKSKNKTGLPDELKTGMENLSGLNLNNVHVHYNSSRPAMIQAHAFAQGNSIHLARGQEKHLPHELGHVVQQMQGRVKATSRFSGVAINENEALEKEATRMGEQSLQCASKAVQPSLLQPISVNRDDEVVQGVWGWLSNVSTAVTESLPSGVGSVVETASNVVGGVASVVGAVSNWWTGTDPGEYFTNDQNVGEPSEARKLYLAWFDAMKKTGSYGTNLGSHVNRSENLVNGDTVFHIPGRPAILIPAWDPINFGGINIAGTPGTDVTVTENTKKGMASGALGGGIGGLLLGGLIGGGVTLATGGSALIPLLAGFLGGAGTGALMGSLGGGIQGGGKGKTGVGAIGASAFPATIAAAVGIVSAALASTGYTAIRATKGAADQTNTMLETEGNMSSAIVNYFDNQRRAGGLNTLWGIIGINALSPIAQLVTPVLTGLASGTINPEQAQDMTNHWKGAGPETFREIAGKDFSDFEFKRQDALQDALKVAAALPHSLAAGILQTTLGTAVGVVKGVDSTADFVAGLIGPGPIASLTLSTNLHSLFKDIDWPAGSDAAVSADIIGALAQFASAPLDLLSGAQGWLKNRDQHDAAHPQTTEQALDQEESMNTFSGGFSNLVRGGAFLGQELTKGVGTAAEPASTIGSSLTQNVVDLTSKSGAATFGYLSPILYGMHHLWRAGTAASQLGKIEGLASYTNMKDREDNQFTTNIPRLARLLPLTTADEPEEQRERFAKLAHEKTAEKMRRNLGGFVSSALATLAVGTGWAPLSLMAGLIGGGLGAYRLGRYLFSGDKKARKDAAKWLTEQLNNYYLPGPTAHDTEVENIVKALVSNTIVNKFKGNHYAANSNEYTKMMDLIKEALASW